MSKMLPLILLYLLHNIHGHSEGNNLEQRPDADLQADLLPQELNTKFVPGNPAPKESLWDALLPIAQRTRRNTNDVVSVDTNAQELLPAQTGLSRSFKMYTRVASCIALVIAAGIEIDSPWRVVLPIVNRVRRNIEEVSETDVSTQLTTNGVTPNFKLYSRVASCIALVVAAVVEIVLYLFEFNK